jgi:hypothetical protein
LLQRCLRGRHAESLVGDLLELHGEGRSTWWYWRQVLNAIVADRVNAVRASGRSLSKSLLVGGCAILVWRALNATFIAHSGDIYWSLRAASVDRTEGLFIVWGLGALLRFVCFILSGWLVARVSNRQPMLAVAVFAASVLLIPVPWQQIRMFEPDVMWPIHYGTALGGILVGAWLALRSRQRYSMITGS